MRIGLITYQTRHLKSAQVLLRLLNGYPTSFLKIYALPYIERRPRAVIFRRRPDQSNCAYISSIAKLSRFEHYLYMGLHAIKLEVGEVHRRMEKEREEEMLAKFDGYKSFWASDE